MIIDEQNVIHKTFLNSVLKKKDVNRNLYRVRFQIKINPLKSP